MRVVLSHAAASRRLVLLVLMLGLVAACGASDRESVAMDFEPASTPLSGSFDVTEGADVLGCSEGTWEDDLERGPDILRIMTCADGGTGSITFTYDPLGYDEGPGVQNGPWEIIEATGDFSGLEGSGDWQGNGASERIEGEVQYTS